MRHLTPGTRRCGRASAFATKHLKGSEDTSYKRKVAEYFGKVGNKVPWQNLGKDFQDEQFRFQVLDEGDYRDRDWRDELKDFENIGAEDLHQLQRAWELQHRILTAESVTRHTLFRQETRWPGYYYRADHPKLDDGEWHVFTGSQYDPQTGEWTMSKLPVHRIVPGFELLKQ